MTSFITQINADNIAKVIDDGDLKEVDANRLKKHLTNLHRLSEERGRQLWIRINYETGRLQFQEVSISAIEADNVPMEIVELEMMKDERWDG